MNVGKLKNNKILMQYKEHGYSTKTELIDDALAYFQRVLKQRQRKNWKDSALASYAESKPEILLESIEGEDFE